MKLAQEWNPMQKKEQHKFQKEECEKEGNGFDPAFLNNPLLASKSGSIL
jgi:hypothetical protein